MATPWETFRDKHKAEGDTRMHIHDFIGELRKNRENASFVNDIETSIKPISDTMEVQRLELPPKLGDFWKQSEATFLHGHVFEDYVLKAALEDERKVLVVVYKTQAKLEQQMGKRKQKFKELYSKYPDEKYEATMRLAGTRAWKILTDVARNSSPGKAGEVQFEKFVGNKVSLKLKKYLRADFFARMGDNVLLVDLKFSTSTRETYEGTYLVNGIIQVLIYAMLMDIKPSNAILGVLVYYSREGNVVLYTTDKRKDPKCMKNLMQIAGIEDKNDLPELCDFMEKMELKEKETEEKAESWALPKQKDMKK